ERIAVAGNATPMDAHGRGHARTLGRALDRELMDALGARKVAIIVEPLLQLVEAGVITGPEIALHERVPDQRFVLEFSLERLGSFRLSVFVGLEDLVIELHVFRRKHREVRMLFCACGGEHGAGKNCGERNARKLMQKLLPSSCPRW